MKTIIIKDFGERNLSNSTKVDHIIPLLTIDDNCFVTIDLSECLIDYPYTSKILDNILFQLDNILCTRKQLTIKYDFVPSEEITLNYLFVGSVFLGIQQDKAYNLHKLKEVINSIFQKQNIFSTLEVVDSHKNVIKTIILR